jgi:hypothetical protein
MSMHRSLVSPLFALSLLAVGAWSCGESVPEGPSGSTDIAAKDASVDAASVDDVSADGGAEDVPSVQDTAEPPPDATEDTVQPIASVCETLGMTESPFRTDAAGTSFGDVAGDFTVQTLNGPWTFSEQFSGCDSYTFINHYTGAAGDQLWASNPAELLANSPLNVHYFFGSYVQGDKSAILNAMKTKVDAALAQMAPQKAEWWGSRIHYVTTDPMAIDGSLGAYYSGLLPSVVFLSGIDRHQRFDAPSSLHRIQNGGFQADVRMAAYAATYYNFLFEQETQAASETVDLATLFDEVLITQNNNIHAVTFPDADTMATYDTMTLDIQARCGPGPTDCGEWDYEAFFQLCDDPECSGKHEIGLWITPYSRPGTRRWLVDATPFLGLLKEGGERHIRFGMLWNMNPNTMTVHFRLSNQGVGMRPTAIMPLFQGGDFNADYNAKYEPFEFTPPETTKKVELVTLLSGHGQTDGNNCAEWCNHVHTFTVNNTPHVKSYPGQAGQAFGCAARVSEGVVPGQYGNWAPSRAAWCPGLPVVPWRQDITGDVTLGASNSMTYAGSFQGGPPVGGRIRLSSYLVYYE